MVGMNDHIVYGTHRDAQPRRLPLRIMLKSKIHRATVTHVDVDYEGSIGIDADLLDAADLLPFEQVHVLDITNGARFETYVMEEPAGCGRIALYGAAGRLVSPGDLVIILGYGVVTEGDARGMHPRVVHVDAHNALLAPSPLAR